MNSKFKILAFILLTIFLLSGIQNQTKAQSLKEIREKAKQLKEQNKKNKNKKNSSSSDTKNTKTTNTTTKSTKTPETQKNTKTTDKLTFDKPVLVEFEQLFKKINLDPGTGIITLKELSIRNLPDANYGNQDSYHKLTAILKSGDKELAKFPFGGISTNTTGEWKKANLIGSVNYKITDGGEYKFVFMVDNKQVDEVKFDILQVLNKNNVAGLFINNPLQRLGVVKAKTISYGKPNPKSPLVFNFYEAILDPEGAFVSATPIDVRLMKKNKDAEDTYLGGYLEQELSHHHKWKLTDNIFFSKPDDKYNYVTYEEITSKNGDYYVDIFYNSECYRYNFTIKDGQFISTLSEKSKPGVCWIEREYYGIPKRDGFRPTAKTAGVADNIRVMVKKGTTSQGYSVGKSAIFTDGQKISANIYLKDDVKNKYMYKLVENIVTIKEGDKIIAQDINQNIFNGSPKFKNLTFDPDEIVMRDKSAFSYAFMNAFSKLSPGNHKLKIIYEIASEKNSNLVGIRTVTYKSVSGNPKFTKWAEDTKSQLEMTDAQLGELLFLRAPSDDWVYYKNNCGTIVWLRQDEYKEYHLFSGDLGKFNRANGYLEQWNFGTLKWKSIDDFKAYKTIYKLGQNQIAMLALKQVPKEAVEKLKQIQDVEFASDIKFYDKVKSLIGDELAKKHKNLIMGTASIDYVNICR